MVNSNPNLVAREVRKGGQPGSRGKLDSGAIVLNAAAMLSTFVLMPPLVGHASPEPNALVRTLAALVPAAIDGLVRDVTVIGPGSDAGMRMIAEDAGCGILEADSFEDAVRSALGRARSATVFLLQSGAAFDHALVDEVGTYFSVPRPAGDAQVLLLRRSASGLLTRVLPRRAPVVGLIAPRTALSGAPKSFEALVRSLRPTRTLAARAQMPG